MNDPRPLYDAMLILVVVGGIVQTIVALIQLAILAAIIRSDRKLRALSTYLARGR
jgi:hypothetical protein